MKRISGRQGLSLFVFVSMLGFVHSIFVDDLWGFLLWSGMLLFFTTSYFHSDLMDAPVSSLKQLLQLRFELDVIQALLLWISYLLWITGLLGPVYFV
ncbi:MAG: hypothetical protein KJ556_00870 [Gammaproteobacteria bacterium]|nr:hypothetical protein [Gammaproteobacteria bacterium]MBU2059105.1 hypothetical protein [Gammaproteobacteria bacterium]MBU2173656.1 hypothetical protein [Gammaproteobacteria bacterium]MBU2246812.1 hypothetical protein [Gammaproteobacteria bacterium]MBU2343804.1 hypothetical protein [Gammaproteobacteria bacterium]